MGLDTHDDDDPAGSFDTAEEKKEDCVPAEAGASVSGLLAPCAAELPGIFANAHDGDDVAAALGLPSFAKKFTPALGVVAVVAVAVVLLALVLVLVLDATERVGAPSAGRLGGVPFGRFASCRWLPVRWRSGRRAGRNRGSERRRRRRRRTGPSAAPSVLPPGITLHGSRRRWGVPQPPAPTILMWNRWMSVNPARARSFSSSQPSPPAPALRAPARRGGVWRSPGARPAPPAAGVDRRGTTAALL
eukprot:SAG22_NODE_113_length_19407_cov_214.925161_13_plen_246_part_00